MTDTKTIIQYDIKATELVMINPDGHKSGLTGKRAEQKFMEIIAQGSSEYEIVMTDGEIAKRRKLNKELHYHLNARAVVPALYSALLAQHGVESSTQLSVEELEELVSEIKCLQSPEDVRKERSGILFLLGKLGIRGSVEEGWDAVNNYLRNPRVAGKTLYEMTYQELVECRKRIRAILWKKGID